MGVAVAIGVADDEAADGIGSTDLGVVRETASLVGLVQMEAGAWCRRGAFGVDAE